MSLRLVRRLLLSRGENEPTSVCRTEVGFHLARRFYFRNRHESRSSLLTDLKSALIHASLRVLRRVFGYDVREQIRQRLSGSAL